ncbi:MAG: hypothetical protein PVI21_01885 [Candidatus Woesebacteria bacterium]|jgi:hypothetical protein
MNIFDKISELNLPKNSYVVVGGGTLVALGLLDWDEDVDICVAPEIFELYKSNGWRQEKWGDKIVLKNDVYDVGVGFGDWTLADLLADSMLVNDIPFISLKKLLQWKQRMGRPKDLLHIELIKKYIKEQQK